jgi:hypothetical protein
MIPMDSPRHILLFSLTLGYRHKSIPIAAQTIARLGQQSARYEAHVSEDLNQFDTGSLWKYDAVCFNQTIGEIPFIEKQRQRRPFQ